MGISADKDNFYSFNSVEIMNRLLHMKQRLKDVWWTVIPWILQTIVWIPAQIILHFFLRLRVEGYKRIKHIRGPVIFVSNHTSYWDPIMIPAALPLFSRFFPMMYVARERNYYRRAKHFIGATSFKVWGAHPAHGGLCDYARSLDDHERFLNQGRSVCMFPEGTLPEEEDSIQPFKGGIGYLVCHTKATIIPVSITGMFSVTAKDFFSRKRRATLTFGEPLTNNPLCVVAKGETPDVECYKKTAEKIREELSVLFSIGYNTMHDYLPEQEYHHAFARPFRAIGRFILNHLHLVPGMNNIARKTNRGAREVLENKTTHQALEVLYRKGDTGKKETFLGNIFRSLWFFTDNAKGVRNRLRIVKNGIVRELVNIHSDECHNNTVHMLSIASGSARAVLEAIQRAREMNVEKDIHVTFLDKSPQAISYSRTLAQSVCDEDVLKKTHMQWVTDTASNFTKYADEGSLDIIEMVGLLDYFDDEKAQRLFEKAYRYLRSGGVFITANIDYNKEYAFVNNFVDWRMIYRSSHELAALARRAGFNAQYMRVYTEPLGVHNVLIVRK